MKRKMDLTVTVLGTLVLIVGLVGCGGGSGPGPQQAEKKKNDSIPVEVTQVERGSISAYFTGTASLEPEGEARVVSKVAGED